jgi:hypothetical protein
VDGMTWETYEQDLDRRIETLHARVQAKAIVHSLDQTVGLRESCLISALIPVRGFKELH